jgi:hypothetical protein
MDTAGMGHTLKTAGIALNSAKFLDYSENYARSEMKAYLSAEALRNVLVSLDQTYGYDHVNLLAHSMGNVVVSEALRLQAVIPNAPKLAHVYAASQSAVAAEEFDSGALTQNWLWDKIRLVPNAGGQPNIYQQSPIDDGHPYFSSINHVTDYLVNFYNPVDYATQSSIFTWTLAQAAKPHNSTGIPLTDLAGLLNVGGTPTITTKMTYELNGSILTITREWIYKSWALYILHPGKQVTGRVFNLSIDIERYEALAFAMAARSVALGATPIVGTFDKAPPRANGETEAPNLWSQVAIAGTSAAMWDHSYQFNGGIQTRHTYWSTLLRKYGLTPDPKYGNL